jgi:hypothetical protein
LPGCGLQPLGGDVELADAAERARHFANVFAKRADVDAAGDPDDREDLAQAARRHARLMDRARVPVDGPRQFFGKSSDTAAQLGRQMG